MPSKKKVARDKRKFDNMINAVRDAFLEDRRARIKADLVEYYKVRDKMVCEEDIADINQRIIDLEKILKSLESK